MNKRFDGDTLNIMLLINNDLKEASNIVFNPRNAMHVSRNDGEMNSFLNLKKDVMILSNALISMTNDGYTVDDYQEIEDCQNWSK